MGPPLAAVPLGAVVSVTLLVSSADEITNLVIEDWLPAGLEPIDPNADGGSGGSGLGGGGGGGGGGPAPMWPWSQGGCYWWWRCTSWSRETRKSSVSFYAAWAYAGSHELTYEAVAVTRGVFTLPPAKAFAALQPEVMGLSAGGALQVSEGPGALRPLLAANASSVRPCPGDCSGRGTCDGPTGTCECTAGAAGDDCSAAALPPSIGPVSVNDTITMFADDASTHTVSIPLELQRAVRPPLIVASDAHPPPPPPSPLPSPSPAPSPAPSAHPRLPRIDLFAFSSDEARLPSSALALALAPDGRALSLRVSLGRLAAATCVLVTIAASADGSSFGTRVLALWLVPSGVPATSMPPPECVGDGVFSTAELPLPIFPSASLSLSAGFSGWGWRFVRFGSDGATFAIVIVSLGAACAVAWGLLRAVSDPHGSKRGLQRLPDGEYPEPADSPGSQAGGYPPTSEPTTTAAADRNWEKTGPEADGPVVRQMKPLW